MASLDQGKGQKRCAGKALLVLPGETRDELIDTKSEFDSAGEELYSMVAPVRTGRTRAARGERQRGRPTKSASARAPQQKRKAKAKRLTKDQIAKPSDYRRKGWAQRLVWTGKKVRTSGGLEQKNLMSNRAGRIVSKLRSIRGQKSYKENHLDLWTHCFVQQRALKCCRGFVKIKKAGNKQERALWEDTYKSWMDMVARRVVKMMQTDPKLMDKINERLTRQGKSHPVPSSAVLAAAGKAWPIAAAASPKR